MEHHFNVDYAIKYGIEEAIIINNLQFWINKNKANNKHFYDKSTWTYNSYKAFSELFPYWNEHKIKRIIDSLISHNVLIKGNYNKSGYDRTCWYAFKDESSFLHNSNIDIAELQNGYDKNASPIPYNKTINKTSTNNFIKPLHTEVTEYAKSIGFILDGEYFCDWNDARGWTYGKNKIKDWKAVVRTWKRNSKNFEPNNKVTTQIKLK